MRLTLAMVALAALGAPAHAETADDLKVAKKDFETLCAWHGLGARGMQTRPDGEHTKLGVPATP